jgi:hypothetical protein
MSTPFKLYQDKSSVLKKNTRYVQGGSTDVFPNSLGWWEKRMDIVRDDASDIIVPSLEKMYDKRPDMLSYVIYGRPDLKWLILMYNNIVDINEEFVAGVRLSLPTPARAFSEILTNTISYE